MRVGCMTNRIVCNFGTNVMNGFLATSDQICKIQIVNTTAPFELETLLFT